MNLTILNRLDIDIYSDLSGISLGFNIHKRGIQFSLIFIDISFFYAGPKWRLTQEQRYENALERMRKNQDDSWEHYQESKKSFEERFEDMIRDKS